MSLNSKMMKQGIEAWKVLFGDKQDINEVIEIIHSEWTIPSVKIVFEAGYEQQKRRTLNFNLID